MFPCFSSFDIISKKLSLYYSKMLTVLCNIVDVVIGAEKWVLFQQKRNFRA